MRRRSGKEHRHRADTPPGREPEGPPLRRLDRFGLGGCVSVDLEVSTTGDRSILALAGVAPNGRRVVWPERDGLSDGRGLTEALSDLDGLCSAAGFVVGHNFVLFDAGWLRSADPRLRLLRLPFVDTLWLNPLAFPQRPYHRLVKHYRDGGLRHSSRNDPAMDAEIVLGLLAEQAEKLAQAPPPLLAAWHWLCCGLDCPDEARRGFDLFFERVRGSARPDRHAAVSAVRGLLADGCCASHASELAQALDAAGASPSSAAAPGPDGGLPGLDGWSVAYALSWLSVAGTASAMPPWVRHQFPDAAGIVRWLRDDACGDAGCRWCAERNDASSEMRRLFGFGSFRPEPTHRDGTPMQQVIVEAAMRGDHVLGILPTGTGKSVCYQVPALSRHDKTGALAVVVSPLVALMADQVDGLRRRGFDSCVAVNGLLSMPERAEAMRRIRIGEAAIVLTSPEQLRSSAFARAVDQREIGSWVLDEAHCLSKWGHDFRPDYRCVAKFIKERSPDGVAPLLCLTATARPEVRHEIVEHFVERLGVRMVEHDGGSQRTNLAFRVERTDTDSKLRDVHGLIRRHLPDGASGGAIVYRATRCGAEQAAAFLSESGLAAEHFHAGLTPDAKKDVQDRFVSGGLQIIAATNAFGMGIDKPDVRLVIHADIPQSLENYVQEAGRAGRDGAAASCVLLYDSDDVERQFSLQARDRLTVTEINGVLRAARRLARRARTREIVATSGELLDADEDGRFRRDRLTEDTRLRTALAWLEEAGLVDRGQNHVRVYPSSLRVANGSHADRRLADAGVAPPDRRPLVAMVDTILEAAPDEGISTDALMQAAGVDSRRVRRGLEDLNRHRILDHDPQLTAYLHVGTRNPSRQRFERASRVEAALLSHLREAAPEVSAGGSWPLNLRAAASQLQQDGHDDVRQEHVTRVLSGLARDRSDNTPALSLRKAGDETLQVRLHRPWEALARPAERRRQGSRALLDSLVRKAGNRRGGDLLVKATVSELDEALGASPSLGVSDAARLRDRSLMWLHEHEVLRLNRGLTVFRPAMTLAVADVPRVFTAADFHDLQEHYAETVRQIHVMDLYAHRGTDSPEATERLLGDYFSLGKADFERIHLSGIRQTLTRQTTPDSWNEIVESLDKTQRRIVADNRSTVNTLVLAGPGSGKTRVLVHRIAYLVRCRRAAPETILALAYNRHAAVEIRRRLDGLIGADARRVTVLTCHSLAMRLTGNAHSDNIDSSDDWFRRVLLKAAALLGGEDAEAEETRSRLLAGLRWILVDEYQDIGPEEYELISAVAGRALADPASKLSLFAVGDDDQNIYTFKGASVEFIHRFQEDYGAEPAHLVENYRSTAAVIEAANTVISEAQNRMKRDHPIRINASRRADPPGGGWAATFDGSSHGKVQILTVVGGPQDTAQAVAAVNELRRLQGLAGGWRWDRCAVIARQWRYLHPVRNLCESLSIDAQIANDGRMSVWHLRETQQMARHAASLDGPISADALAVWLRQQPDNRWTRLLAEAVDELRIDGTDLPAAGFREWLAEWCRSARRRQRGLLLTTAHSAKGLEFDHVVVMDGGWAPSAPQDLDPQRRLYYVAMTRARRTLALLRSDRTDNPMLDALQGVSPYWACAAADTTAGASPAEGLDLQHTQLELRDTFLSFAGYKPPDDPVHAAIAALQPGDPLRLARSQNGRRWELRDRHGRTVGTLAASYEPKQTVSASVGAVAEWDRACSDPQYRDHLRCDRWEVVVPALMSRAV